MPEVPPIRQPREVARVIGRGFRAVGRGIYETGAGFVEGLGVPEITPRKAGRVAGRVIRKMGEAPRDLTFRDPDYFWGDWERTREPKKPTSRLPIETQSIMIKYLGELHPEIYIRIWYQGVTYSEFIGTLRNNFPDIYEEMRDYTYAYPKRYPETRGYPPETPRRYQEPEEEEELY